MEAIPLAGGNCEAGATMTHDCGTYAVASRDIVFESFDGEAVVLNLANGKYFGFSDSGSRVWQALSSGVNTEALIGLTVGGSTRTLQVDATSDDGEHIKLKGSCSPS